MEEKKSAKKKLSANSTLAAIAFTRLSMVWLMIIFLLSLFELTYNGLVHQFPKNFTGVISWTLLNDLLFWLKCQIYLFVIYTVLHLFSQKFARITFSVFIVLMAVVQLSLTSYFTTSLVPLGADLYGYSPKDIKQTISASGISLTEIIGFIVMLGITIAALWGLAPRIRLNRYLAFAFLVMSFLFVAIGAQAMIGQAGFKSDFENNLVINKSDHFWVASYKHFFPGADDVDIYADSYISDYGNSGKEKSLAFNYTDPQHYPFLHSDSAADVLSPFFKGNPTPPNIVIVVVEGLGRAFTNEGAYLGNFTPFIDSLSGKSLYWKNFLSEGGRTFAVLPSILGSLPFAKNG
ncbi:MAG: phosphoglycerol transferase, partial [Mucilaginibacter sp.]|nr:phosphoglycerol transferase [Mucilaginibacter sp.]